MYSKRQKRMTTRLIIRLTAPVVATSLLLLAVGVGAAWYVHALEKSVSDDIRNNAHRVRAAEEVEIDVLKIRTRLDRYLLTNNRHSLEGIRVFFKETDHWLTEAQQLSTTSLQKKQTSQARAGYDRFNAELDKTLRELPDNGPQNALPPRIRELIDLLTHEVQDPIQEYLDANEEELESSIKHNQEFATRLVVSLLLLGTCGSGAGLIGGFGFARGFSQSMIQLSVPIRDAAGHLDEVVGPVTFAGGDFEQMESALRLIADRIGAVVDRLRHSEREVLRAEQFAVAGQMAAGMAHELRNPLTSMKILVQAAQASSDAALTGRDLIVLEEEIRRLERLVQTFLQFARPPQPEKKVRDLHGLVTEVVELMAARAARVGTRLEVDLPESPSRVEVDADQIRQVLLNLVLNAQDAVGEGGVIRLELANGPPGWITLQVTDSGVGLPAELGPTIFAPFVTTKETGLGLGLSICKRIAEAHGGDIAAANRPEGGAVFTLRLPAAEERVCPS
jgi:two-component system, NtrC family, sensor histidine kinase HydH